MIADGAERICSGIDQSIELCAGTAEFLFDPTVVVNGFEVTIPPITEHQADATSARKLGEHSPDGFDPPASAASDE